MVAITFPVSHSPGQRASEGAGRLYCCYAEPMGEGGRARAVLHRSPGLVNFGTTTRTGFRGAIEVAGIQYSAFSGKLEKLPSAGGASSAVGTLTGTKKGFFARNNAATPDKVFVDPDGNIATFTTSAVTSGFDSDLPAVNSVASLDGYFLFTTGSGQIWATGLNAVTVNALAFTTAESNPDGLYRGVTWGDHFYACGSKTIEVYNDAGTSPFPLARVTVIQRGIAGPYCVTGFEDGFSKGLHIVGDDNCVYSISGYTPNKISPPDLDGLIEAVSDKTTLEMCSYISRGHSFIQISCPAWTWVYNINNQKWHERPSYLITRSRITQAFYSFDKWLCGDTVTGNIQRITATARDEVGNPLQCEVWSAPVQKFPARVRVATMWFDFAVGVGNAEGSDPTETDPDIEISWSDDGGQTFCNPRLRKLGRQSEGKTRVRVNQCGMTGSQGRIVKVKMSSSTHFGLMGGEMASELRAA